MKRVLLALACSGSPMVLAAAEPAGSPAPTVAAKATSAEDFLADAQRVLNAAVQPAAPWNGPRSGPRAQPGRHIAVVGEDLRNGGILGVAQGVREATGVIGWGVKVFDCGGTMSGRSKALTDALASAPDGLMLIGPDARAILPGLLPFAERGIPIVGWHVASRAGTVAGTPVAINVSTDPLEVARVTALAAIVESGGHAGVVVFTDTSLELPKTKANAMADVIRTCAGCTLLEVSDVAISRSPELIPQMTRDLLARYGKRWTHALAINDIYFDYAAPVLTQAGLPNRAIRMLSAGDGSETAFLRIRAGTFQTGTVAEPLSLHAWQLVDEMNRLFAKEAISGYVFPVHLVTPDNIASDSRGLMYDPANGYRDVYRRIWQRP